MRRKDHRGGRKRSLRIILIYAESLSHCLLSAPTLSLSCIFFLYEDPPSWNVTDPSLKEKHIEIYDDWSVRVKTIS